MSLEDDFFQTIEDSLAAKQREIDEEQQAESRWMSFRRENLEPMLRDARAACKRKSWGAESEPDNGSISLHVWVGKRTGKKYTLKFKPNKKTKEVNCSMSTGSSVDITLDSLIESGAASFVHDFLRAVAADRSAPPPRIG